MSASSLVVIYLFGVLAAPIVIGMVDDNAPPGAILLATVLWPVMAPVLLLLALYTLGTKL